MYSVIQGKLIGDCSLIKDVIARRDYEVAVRKAANETVAKYGLSDVAWGTDGTELYFRDSTEVIKANAEALEAQRSADDQKRHPVTGLYSTKNGVCVGIDGRKGLSKDFKKAIKQIKWVPSPDAKWFFKCLDLPKGVQYVKAITYVHDDEVLISVVFRGYVRTCDLLDYIETYSPENFHQAITEKEVE